jgi:hypothetical protein
VVAVQLGVRRCTALCAGEQRTHSSSRGRGAKQQLVWSALQVTCEESGGDLSVVKTGQLLVRCQLLHELPQV